MLGLTLEPFKTYSIDSDIHNWSYVILVPVEKKKLTPRDFSFKGWVFWKSIRTNEVYGISIFGKHDKNFLGTPGIATIKEIPYNINKELNRELKQNIIISIFEEV